MAKKTDRRDTDDKIDATADAFMRHQDMEDAADYLTRGRRFQSLAEETLRERWIALLKQWVASRDDYLTKELRDLGTEIELRGNKLPVESVERELAAVRRAFEDEDPDSEPSNRMRRRIAEFRRKLDEANKN
jgi:hypothetical protein